MWSTFAAASSRTIGPLRTALPERPSTSSRTASPAWRREPNPTRLGQRQRSRAAATCRASRATRHRLMTTTSPVFLSDQMAAELTAQEIRGQERYAIPDVDTDYWGAAFKA